VSRSNIKWLHVTTNIHTSVRGYHVYKDVWEAALGQLLPCQRQPGNTHDPYAVAVVETGVATQIVGHGMYHVLYLRLSARFPICSFSSGVKCWYGDCLDVTVVTSHVMTA